MSGDRDALIDLIVRRVAARDDQFAELLPALRTLLAGESVPTLFEIVEALDAFPADEFVRVRRQIDQRLLALARRARTLRQMARPWTDSMREEFRFLDDVPTDAPSAERALEALEGLATCHEHGIERAFREGLKSIDRRAIPWRHIPWRAVAQDFALPDLAFEDAGEPEAEPVSLTDLLQADCAEWASTVQAFTHDRSARRRLAVGYALLHGTAGRTPREVVMNRQQECIARREQLDRRGARLADEHGEALARVMVELWPGATDAMRERVRPPEPESPAEPPPAREPEPVARPEKQAPVVPTPAAAAAPAPPPPEPPRPSIWSAHLQPFLLENWYVAVGALMVVVGSSLLAFFTWDRHWAIRYTVLPALLGAFTGTLAWLGGWLERRDATLTGTAAVLRGAAIALLPINFMTVALLANDPEIGSPRLVVPLVAALYLGVFGAGLRAWCRGVHPALAGLLGGTLIALCALVVLRPLAITLAVDEPTVRTVLGAGFYLGFALLAAAVIRFNARVLDGELAREKRVPWFFGATLLLTFLQVFVWVHASMDHLPRVHTYAPMVVLAGGLLLRTERRVLALSGADAGRMGAESFLGYAVVLLGLLMAQPDPRVRVLGFLLAGVVWVRQAGPRDDRLHAWIGLTLIAFGGGSVALLPSFPGAWRGWLGLGLALLFGAASAVLRRGGRDVLAETARALQVVLAVISSVVAMLAQWHYGSEPLGTAALLLLASAVLFVRAHRDGRERWVLTGAVLPALALPYLGCVDLAGRTWNGNTMVFGLGVLSLLWIAVDLVRPTPWTRRARSTVLWFYGALAVAGMTLRVVLETGTAHPVLDHSGPLLSALALVFATYWSRSLVPAGMAAAILVILFPELRAHYRAAFQALGWGSGLGSAVSSAALVGVALLVRRRPGLARLEGGDRFLGRSLFPLRRHDWTLFTWPIAASVVFLLVKLGSIVLARNLEAGMTPRAAFAQVVGGGAWLLLAAFGRREAASRQAVRLGFLQAFAGLVLWPWDPWTWSWPVLVYGLSVQAFALAVRRAGPPWSQPLLAAPAFALLRRGAVVVVPLCLVSMLPADVPRETHALVAFVAVLLSFAGVTRRRELYGLVLTPLLLAEALYLAKGVPGPLLGAGLERFVLVSASFLLGVQLVAAAVVGAPRVAGAVPPLLRPAHLWSWAILLVAAFYANGSVLIGRPFALPALVAVAAAAFAIARNHASGFYFVVGASVVYFACLRTAPVLDLARPRHVGLFALALAAAGTAGVRLRGRLGLGAAPLPFDRVPARLWAATGAAATGLGAAALHAGVPSWREAAAELPGPYFAAAAWFLAGRLVRARSMGYGVAALFALANVHLVRVLAGPWLAGQGITDIQVAGIGIGLTLLCALAMRRRVRATDIVDRSLAALATLLLVLLATQYVARTDLAAMTPRRLLVSGALAYGAAFAFRTMARRPHDPVAVPVRFAESAYHLGLTVSLWCLALLIPVFRQPSAALVALSLPFFFFVLRADRMRGRDDRTERQYVESASILGYLLLALYLLRGIFQIVLFPGTPVRTDHYHHNAPLVMAVGLGLLRLHVHGPGEWRAFYGGVALIAGSYFAVSAFPGLSPFESTVPAGWTLIAMAHFWTLASTRRSPLRTGMQQLAGIDEREWHALRRGWGVLLLVAAQLPPMLAASAAGVDSHAIAPLLAGSASVVIHHAFLRRVPLYAVVAAVELLFALHLDLLAPSYLPWRLVVWILLAAWAGLLAADAWRPLPLRAVRSAANLLAPLVAAHVLLHHPASAVGWTAFASGVALFLATPRPVANWTHDAADEWTPALLLAPAWLAYFAALPARRYLDAWPVLAGALALLGTGGFATWVRGRAAAMGVPGRPRLAHRLFDLLRRRGDAFGRAGLYAGFAVASASFALHYARPFEPRELVCLCMAFAACAVGFHLDGRARRAMIPYYLLQLSVLALFAAVRRHLMLTTDFWTHEYDVWAACTTTVALAGAKEVVDLRPREVGVPVTSALFALPVVAMIWTVVHGLGVNVALLVLGVHSLTYSFLGRDDRESPYHLVAVAGFVGFVLLTFWSKLELRSIQAYVVPVGIGVLVLAQLFRARLSPGVRQQVRFAAVAAMIGSSAYEALIGDRYPVGFHVSLLLLGLAGMGLGGFLRVRIYLWTGCAGVLIALGSIAYRGLAGLERAARMSAVGVLVLLLGAALVAGAIYYKTHRARVNERIDGWRRRLGEWD